MAPDVLYKVPPLFKPPVEEADRLPSVRKEKYLPDNRL
jgi:hypothetical protein